MGFITRFGVNMILLPIWALVMMATLAVVDRRQIDEPVVGNVLFTALMYWQTFLLPAIAYLLILERLPGRWSGWRSRAAAIALSPVIVLFPLIAAAVDGGAELRYALRTILAPTLYGLFVLLPPRLERRSAPAPD